MQHLLAEMVLVSTCSPSYTPFCMHPLDIAYRDLPPSRALAIAEGRLDPISMSAFDELTCAEPQTPLPIFSEPQTLTMFSGKEPMSVRGSSERDPNFRKEDVWLGTDEELFAMLAGTDSSAASSNPTSIAAANAPHEVRRDSGFVAHIASISSSRVVPQPLSEQGPTACSSRLVTLSPGKKRVLPPQPNNNPFKRGRKLGELSIGSNNAACLFNGEIDEQLFSRKDTHLEKINSTFRVQHHADHCEQAQSSGKARSLVITEESVFTEGGGSKAALVPLHPQSSKREEDYDDMENVAAGPEMDTDAQILMASLYVEQASVKVEEFGSGACEVGSLDSGLKAQVPIKANAFKQPDVQDWHTPDENLVFKQSCDVSTALDTLPLAPIQLSNAVSDGSRTAVTSKGQQRECKTKKEIRSSRQSTKVVVSPTPGLLKFFQRAPTLR